MAWCHCAGTVLQWGRRPIGEGNACRNGTRRATGRHPSKWCSLACISYIFPSFLTKNFPSTMTILSLLNWLERVYVVNNIEPSPTTYWTVNGLHIASCSAQNVLRGQRLFTVAEASNLSPALPTHGGVQRSQVVLLIATCVTCIVLIEWFAEDRKAAQAGQLRKDDLSGAVCQNTGVADMAQN